jgi:hypothetical protein
MIALKTDENLITLAENFETKHIISALIAYLYFLSGFIIKISFRFTSKTKKRAIIIHEEFFTFFNKFACLDYVPGSNLDINQITASVLNSMTKPIIFFQA